MRHSIWLAGLVGLVGLAAAAPARAAEGWERLGERRVDGRMDRDVIRVGAHEGRFRKIMLKVEGSPIELFDVRVTFGDGESWSPATRLVFAPETTTRVIDLPGDARIIRAVEFRYGKLARRRRATVELWAAAAGSAPGLGERADDRRDELVEARTGWDKLGERWVDGRADRDVIDVGAREGRFRRIALRVEHSAVEMFDVRVTFGDGQVYSPPTRLVFDRNTNSRIIDLPGDARVIRRVEFRYGNLPGGGRAQVELWAR